MIVTQAKVCLSLNKDIETILLTMRASKPGYRIVTDFQRCRVESIDQTLPAYLSLLLYTIPGECTYIQMQKQPAFSSWCNTDHTPFDEWGTNSFHKPETSVAVLISDIPSNMKQVPPPLHLSLHIPPSTSCISWYLRGWIGQRGLEGCTAHNF